MSDLKSNPTPISDEAKTFNDIRRLNWAWVFKNSKGRWTQFECVVCMILESRWKLYQTDQTIQVKIKLGTVNFARMVAVYRKRDGSIEEYPIHRTESNKRERPDADKRHENNVTVTRVRNLNLIN